MGAYLVISTLLCAIWYAYIKDNEAHINTFTRVLLLLGTTRGKFKNIECHKASVISHKYAVIILWLDASTITFQDTLFIERVVYQLLSIN